jgi:hypothetical protein
MMGDHYDSIPPSGQRGSVACASDSAGRRSVTYPKPSTSDLRQACVRMHGKVRSPYRCLEILKGTWETIVLDYYLQVLLAVGTSSALSLIARVWARRHSRRASSSTNLALLDRESRDSRATWRRPEMPRSQYQPS